MAERIIKEILSDISLQAIPDGQVVQLHVDHPEMQEAPTHRLDVTPEEAEQLRKIASPAVRVMLYAPTELGEVSPPELLTVPVAKFEGLFKGIGKKAVEVLVEAPVVGKKVNPSNGNGETGRDYASLEWAGTPKKGRTSQEEAEFVRNNLDAVNARLERDGMRKIDLNDPEHVKRYGLQELVELAKFVAAGPPAEVSQTA